MLTEHVSTLVLATSLLCNVALDAQINQREVLDVEIGGVDAPNHAKALAVVNVAAHLLELWPQGGEREVPGLNQISILAQGWVVSVVRIEKVGEKGGLALVKLDRSPDFNTLVFVQNKGILGRLRKVGSRPGHLFLELGWKSGGKGRHLGASPRSRGKAGSASKRVNGRCNNGTGNGSHLDGKFLFVLRLNISCQGPIVFPTRGMHGRLPRVPPGGSHVPWGDCDAEMGG